MLNTVSNNMLNNSAQNANNAKTEFVLSGVQLAGMGIISAGIWIWNIRDVKKRN